MRGNDCCLFLPGKEEAWIGVDRPADQAKAEASGRTGKEHGEANGRRGEDGSREQRLLAYWRERFRASPPPATARDCKRDLRRVAP